MRKATGSSRGAGKARNRSIKILESILNRPFEPVEDSDLTFFELVTGRKPKSAVAVARRCRFGHPMAFVSLPVLDKEPFPTVFWLTCPYLLKSCGKLESALFHRHVESEIEKNEKLSTEFRAAHEKLREVRKALAEDASLVLPDDVLNAGIGGVKNLSAVKCLHAHMAAALAGIESPVSRALYEAITALECHENCVAGK